MESFTIESLRDNNEMSDINISDVIAAIERADPMFSASTALEGDHRSDGNSMNELLQPGSSQNQQGALRSARRKGHVRIIEQPTNFRFRYESEGEGRTAGSIPGVNSTPENKTYPTIEIVDYVGPAVIVVSCVTKDPPYRPHPHNLVGKGGCDKGVCTVQINSETMKAVFSNLGIQCVKKNEIGSALRAREEIRVDPFKTGFSHRSQPASIDLKCIRLCFQVFIQTENNRRCTTPLTPVVSDIIIDKKTISDLVICRLSKCSCTVDGNKEIILLCDKVTKEDIAVRFFEEKDGQIVWEGYGEFQPTDIHKQTAINFRTPKYRSFDINHPVKVFIQLQRPSDGATSDPLPFDYLPLHSDPNNLKRKRLEFGGDANSHLFRHMQTHEQQTMQELKLVQNSRQQLEFLKKLTATTVTAELKDTAPHSYGNTTSCRISKSSPSSLPLSPSSPLFHPGYSMHAGENNLIPSNNQQQYGGTVRNSNINPDMIRLGTSYQTPYELSPQQYWNLPESTTSNIMDNVSPSTPAIYKSPSQQLWTVPADTSEEHLLSLSVGEHLEPDLFMMGIGQQPQQQQRNQSLQFPSNTNEGPNVRSLFDLDSEQLLMEINSTEISGLSLSDNV